MARLLDTMSPSSGKTPRCCGSTQKSSLELPALRHREDADRIGPEQDVRRQLEFARTGFHRWMVKRPVGRRQGEGELARPAQPAARSRSGEREAKPRKAAFRWKEHQKSVVLAPARGNICRPCPLKKRHEFLRGRHDEARNDPGVRDHRAACFCIRGWKRRRNWRRWRRGRRGRRRRAGRRGRGRHGRRDCRRRGERAGPHSRGQSTAHGRSPVQVRAPRRRRTTRVTAARLRRPTAPNHKIPA